MAGVAVTSDKRLTSHVITNSDFVPPPPPTSVGAVSGTAGGQKTVSGTFCCVHSVCNKCLQNMKIYNVH